MATVAHGQCDTCVPVRHLDDQSIGSFQSLHQLLILQFIFLLLHIPRLALYLQAQLNPQFAFRGLAMKVALCVEGSRHV